MTAQQVDNVLDKLSANSFLNHFEGINHDADMLHVFYTSFTLLNYEALVEFCAEEELFFYSAPNKQYFQLTLINDPVYEAGN
ncbi:MULTISPECIES: hypothetical protein [Emticicia]|uniref:hypothetical protein n=1 Tax=Emticicia TaxID=312278 RepID=UPI0020A1FEA1|nr:MULTISPECIES: hypothetical protein [Emticicia]UTA66638.1 hypothetical protein MB380_13610 [Emticicia sp. 21SJ11W-3]